MHRPVLVAALALPLLAACTEERATPAAAAAAKPVSPAEAQIAAQPCGAGDKPFVHEINRGETTHGFTPCSANGAVDYSGSVTIDDLAEGVRVFIDAHDDAVEILGGDVRDRDAVVLYPKSERSEALEIPLTPAPGGYHGDRILPWDTLAKLVDDGTRIDLAIFDHDKASGQPTEELHVAIAVTMGPSCEKALEGAGAPVAASAEIAQPMKSKAFLRGCRLPPESKGEVCAVVKDGEPVGVSVSVTPKSNKLVACIDDETRKLKFPAAAGVAKVVQPF
jgi:hypothetical protein